MYAFGVPQAQEHVKSVTSNTTEAEEKIKALEQFLREDKGKGLLNGYLCLARSLREPKAIARLIIKTAARQ